MVLAYFYALLKSTKCSDCKAFINELNIVEPKSPETHEFIELKSSCKDLPLRGYKIIGFSCLKSSGYVELVINLWNARMKNGFFTVGGSGVKSANINVPNPDIKFRDSFKTSSGTLSNFIVNGDKSLRAIGLLYGEKNPFSEFVLTKKTNRLRIDDKITEQMKNNLVDLVVYGGEVPCDKCALFEMIHNSFVNKKYTLRDFPANTGKKDITLNRCTLETGGFLPEKYKLGKPTPSNENDCSGPNFLLEESILNAIPTVISQGMYLDDYDDQNGACSSSAQTCTSSIDEVNYVQITSSGIANAIEMANKSSGSNTCSPLNLNSYGGNIVQQLEQDNTRKRHMGVEADYSQEYEWTSTKHFK